MPPIIEVSDETLKELDQLKIPYSMNVEQSQKDFIYIPSAKLHFAKQKTLQGNSWSKTHELLSKERLAMPTSLEFAQTLKYLRDNPNAENTGLYNEITQIRSPWRATWLDACFEKRKDGFYVLTRNKTREEKLDKDTLMEDKRISLDSWIENPTSEGLPRKNVAKGDLYFWSPRNGSVVRFNAGCDVFGLVLDCDRGPADRNSILGVHAVRCE